MDTKTLDLRGLGDAARDAKVNAAIAEHVAGFRWRYSGTHAMLFPHPLPKSMDYAEDFRITPPRVVKTRDALACCPLYATSADAVLPLLEKAGNIVIVRDSSVWSVDINEERGSVETDDYDVVTIGTDDAPTLAQAACVALLRANGFEVIT